MRHRTLFWTLGIVAVAGTAFAGTTFADIGDVRLHGPLGERLDRITIVKHTACSRCPNFG